MKTPLELTFRHVPRSQKMVTLVNEEVAKLEKICDYIVSCHVVIDQPQKHQKRGNPYGVRIQCAVPPGHDLVAKHEPAQNSIPEQLPVVVQETFDALRRQLKELVERQRRDIKNHSNGKMPAKVLKLFKAEGYGFLQSADAREIYFHRNSIVNGVFEDVRIGTHVRYTEEEGEKGPQASSVQIMK